jgi:hypothetical protein
LSPYFIDVIISGNRHIAIAIRLDGIGLTYKLVFDEITIIARIRNSIKETQDI